MSNDPSEPDAAAGGPNEGVAHAADPSTWASPVHGPSAPTDAEPHGSPGAAQHSADVPHDAGATAELPAPYGRDPQGRPAVGVAGQHGAAPGGWPAPAYGAPAGWPPATRIENSRTPQPDPGAWYGAPVGGRLPEHPTGDPRYPGHGGVGGGFGPPPPGAHFLEPPPRGGRGGAGSRGGLYALGLVAVLLAGVIGGVVGNLLARDDRSGSIGVLGEPLPEVDESAAPTTPVEAIAARVLPSVVQLRVEGASSSGEGSAMVLSADGLLLTNNHVVEAAADAGNVTAVFQDGTTAAALIIGRDPSSDLAVLRAQKMSGLIPVELGNSDSVRVGQQVVAFGAPLGLGGTVTTGIISAIDRAVNVGEETGANTPTVLNALQTDAAINPGNSGGPLVDMQGRVVGINSAIATTGAQGGSIGVGFSIPVNQARRVAEELERTGRASRAILGVTVGDDPRQAGAVIRGVTPGGAAEQAGIRTGDVVLRFGDQRISTGTDLQAAVGSRAPGEVVEVQLADRTVQATLGTAPN